MSYEHLDYGQANGDMGDVSVNAGVDIATDADQPEARVVLDEHTELRPLPAPLVIDMPKAKPAIAGLNCIAPMEGFHSKRGSHPF